MNAAEAARIAADKRQADKEARESHALQAREAARLEAARRAIEAEEDSHQIEADVRRDIQADAMMGAISLRYLVCKGDRADELRLAAQMACLRLKADGYEAKAWVNEPNHMTGVDEWEYDPHELYVDVTWGKPI